MEALMDTKAFSQLPLPIQAQVRVLLDDAGLAGDEAAQERLAGW